MSDFESDESMPLITLKRKRPRECISSGESDKAEDGDMEIRAREDQSQIQTPSRPNTPITETPTTSCSPSYLNLNSKQLLQKIFERQEEILQRLKSVENAVESTNKSGKVSDSNGKVNVSTALRHAVRTGYSDGEKRGLKWEFEGKRILDRENQDMNSHITTFVKGLNPMYTDNAAINCAIARYFMTKKQEEASKKKNKLDTEKKRRVLYERKKEKSKRRLSALETMNLGDSKKEMIAKVIKPAYTSTDEECDEGFITHQPSWQSQKFKKYKNILDSRYIETCSTKSKRLMQKRTIGSEHNKEQPLVSEDMTWIINDSTSGNTEN